MRYIFPVVVIVLCGVVVCISICDPHIIAGNKFLSDFIEDQILNILAVIMTISITSIATIHIWFNEIEEKHDKKVFGKAREQVNQSAYFFIACFVGVICTLIIRAYFDGNERAISLLDGTVMIILLCSVFTLADLMGVIKSLTPKS